jgi:predicted aspartyl protease
MNIRFTLCSLAVALLLAGCAGPQPAENIVSTSPRVARRAPSTVVPIMRATNGQWLVHATVNGQPGLFAIDTGAPATILAPKFVSKLDLPVQTVKVATADGLGTKKAKVAQVNDLALGDLDCLSFQARILNLDHLDKAGQFKLDGILGNNVFGTSQCTFNWRSNTLTLNSRALPAPPGAVPVTIRANQIYFMGTVNGMPVEFALDTGAYCSLLSESDEFRLNIPPDKKTDVAAMQVDISQAREVKQTRVVVDALKFAHIERSDFPMIMWNHSVIGMDLLEPWILTFDMRRNWMTLSWPDAAPPR